MLNSQVIREKEFLPAKQPFPEGTFVCIRPVAYNTGLIRNFTIAIYYAVFEDVIAILVNTNVNQGFCLLR